MNKTGFPRLLPFGLAHNCVDIITKHGFFFYASERSSACLNYVFFNNLFLSATRIIIIVSGYSHGVVALSNKIEVEII